MGTVKSLAPLLLLAPLTAWTSPSYAAKPCSGVELTEVRSLEGLPPMLRALLPKATHGPGGIADHGAPFMSGDAIREGDDTPRRRFEVAGVGSTCAILAVTFGGMAFHVSLIEYRLGNSGWTPNGPSHSVARIPDSLASLLADFE